MSVRSGPIVLAAAAAPAAPMSVPRTWRPKSWLWRSPALLVLIGAAWLVAIGAQVTGNAGLLHHHALIEGGPSLVLAVPLFLLSWQVMIAATMLPASVPAIRVAVASMAHLARPRLAGLAFLGAFALVWTVLGLAAFAGDDVLHHIVDATPWLEARPWLIEGGVLALAGIYQLLPIKRRSLAECRHPVSLVAAPDPRPSFRPGRGSFVLGLDHAFACVCSSWALMLLMFAEGFANLWWMVALTALMVYETSGRHGQRAASVAGILLVALAAATLVSGVRA